MLNYINLYKSLWICHFFQMLPPPGPQTQGRWTPKGRGRGAALRSESKDRSLSLRCNDGFSAGNPSLSQEKTIEFHRIPWGIGEFHGWLKLENMTLPETCWETETGLCRTLMVHLFLAVVVICQRSVPLAHGFTNVGMGQTRLTSHFTLW